MLRSRRLAGFKFRRQQPVGPYVLDFYSFKSKLAIEVDGGGHTDPAKQEYDRIRSQYLASLGIRVVRFWNNEVRQDPDAVLEKVLVHLRL